MELNINFPDGGARSGEMGADHVAELRKALRPGMAATLPR